jgi:purine nucleosidase
MNSEGLSLLAKKKLLFFSDFGVDDIMAVLYAFFSANLDMVGIVVDYGNISKENALRNVRYLKKLTGREDIPVFGGAAVPLTGKNPIYYPDVHGPAGLGPIVPVPDLFSFNFENFYEINSLIKKYENEIILFCSGRLSSLATMFILYPEMMKKVKDIYIMGGAFHSPGNVTPTAEANFYSDPYAVNLVLEQAPIKTHIVPLDVTKYAILTPQMVNDLDRFYKLSNNHVGLIIKPMVDFYFQFYKSRSPQITGSPLHDLLALWSLEDHSKIVFETVPVRILVEEGEGFGQSIGDFRKDIMKAPWPVHYVAKEFDYSQFISQVIQTFKSIPVNNTH